jgi:hypothetical protein
MSRRRPRQPQAQAPIATPFFVVLPVPQLPGATPATLQQTLYQLALQQAQEQAGSTITGLVGRDWLGTWN